MRAPDSEQTLLKEIAGATLGQLMAIWAVHRTADWTESPNVYCKLTRKILGHGEPLLAYDVVAEALKLWPADISLRQLQGLALARSGATDRANAILLELRNEGARDEETLGMLGRTYKDLAERAKSPQREELFRNAAEIYNEAYQTNGGYYTGINAAAMNLIVGEEGRACAIAEKVRQQCLAEVEDPAGDPYWEYAALGEAALICRHLADADRWYARAGEQAQKRYGDLQSSRRNARLILNYWGEELPSVENHLHVPAVMVFAGHMIDRPGRGAPRFRPADEPAVAKQIEAEVERLKPGFGFSSAACGSDILFLEAMLRRGAEVTVVLPYQAEQFIADSVDVIPGSNWRDRFDRILQSATRVVTASSQRLELGGVSYEFCNEMILGLGSIKARQLDTELLALAVWNGQTGDGPGGSASVVESWRSLGLNPVVIGLPHAQADPPGRDYFGGEAGAHGTGFASRIVAILFADAVGFSKLDEAEVPRFVEHFFGAIAALARNFSGQILARNTWGDGLYFIFCDVAAAGEFGLELAALAAHTDWNAKGLRSGLNLRIGLHAGPVYEFDDPITGSRTYSGTHVSRAARIEPITPPGNVYASESFAALAAAHGARGFTCNYVGQTPLAKDYGAIPTYHMRRTQTNYSLTG
ncbi:MAG: TRAFs-binding domain-containing protein [Chthoniobacterales bacterium]